MKRKRRRSKKKGRGLNFLLLCFLCSILFFLVWVLVYVVLYWHTERCTPPFIDPYLSRIFSIETHDTKATRIDNALTQALSSLGVSPQDFLENYKMQEETEDARGYIYVKKVRISPRLDLDIIGAKIGDAVNRSSGKVLSKYEKRSEDEIEVAYKIGSEGCLTHILTLKQKLLPKVAIIIDDFGYSDSTLDDFLSLGYPISFSILPHLHYTKDIARRVNREGFEVILHLPMESYGYSKGLSDPGPGAIYVDMDDEVVLETLERNLEEIPYIKGVNNHMGSKATSDERIMKIVLRHLKYKGLFFIDSLSTSKSVTQKVANELNFSRVLFRDVFLDNEDDYDYISGQFEKLIRKAKQRGFAIGIGHAQRRETIAVLRDLLPVYDDEVLFVSVSDLLKVFPERAVLP